MGYIDLGWFHVPLIAGLNNFIKGNLGYIDIGVLHATVIGGLIFLRRELWDLLI